MGIDAFDMAGTLVLVLVRGVEEEDLVVDLVVLMSRGYDLEEFFRLRMMICFDFDFDSDFVLGEAVEEAMLARVS